MWNLFVLLVVATVAESLVVLVFLPRLRAFRWRQLRRSKLALWSDFTAVEKAEKLRLLSGRRLLLVPSEAQLDAWFREMFTDEQAFSTVDESLASVGM